MYFALKRISVKNVFLIVFRGKGADNLFSIKMQKELNIASYTSLKAYIRTVNYSKPKSPAHLENKNFKM